MLNYYRFILHWVQVSKYTNEEIISIRKDVEIYRVMLLEKYTKWYALMLVIAEH